MTAVPSSLIEGLRIMIVDDEELVRNMVATMLKRMGVREVITAASAQEAIAIVNAQHIDLAIVDWQLGDMAGEPLIRELRNARPGDHERMELFVLTGFPVPDRVEAATRAGADEFLVKPLSGQLLQRHVEAVAAGQRAHARAPY